MGAIHRYEIKIAATHSSILEIEEWLALSPFFFRKAYPNRTVNNLYLDTLDLKAYNDNVAGISERQKIRLRWYGDTLNPHAATLEKKNKKGRLGWKESVQTRFENVALEEMGRAQLLEHLSRNIPTPFFFPFDHLEPSLYNRYERQYFEDALREVRVTVDTNLCFSAPTEAQALGNAKNPEQTDHVIVEIKFDREKTEAGMTVASSMPFRSGKFSKYVRGIEKVLNL